MDHLLSAEDLAAAVAPPAEDGLPWREGGCWPLDEEQRHILAYETFLLHLQPHRPPHTPEAQLGTASAGGSTSRGELGGGAAPQPASLTVAAGCGASPPDTDRPVGSTSLSTAALTKPAGGGDDQLALDLPADLGIDEASCEALADELSRSLSSSLYRPPDKDHLASLLPQGGPPRTTSAAALDACAVGGARDDPVRGMGSGDGGAAASRAGGVDVPTRGGIVSGPGGSEIQRWLTQTVTEWREAAVAAANARREGSGRDPTQALSMVGVAHASGLAAGISSLRRGASRAGGGGSLSAPGGAGGGLPVRPGHGGVETAERECVRAVRTRLKIPRGEGMRLARLLRLPPPPVGWWRGGGDAEMEERASDLGRGTGASGGGGSRPSSEEELPGSPSWAEVISGVSPPHLRAPPAAPSPSRAADPDPAASVPAASTPGQGQSSTRPAQADNTGREPTLFPGGPSAEGATVSAVSFAGRDNSAQAGLSARPIAIPGSASAGRGSVAPQNASLRHSSSFGSCSGQKASSGDASSLGMFGDVECFVPYRLLLLLLLTPDHFASRAEWAAFAERQLAAFCAGVLAAVWAAPEGTLWDVAVGGGGGEGGGGGVGGGSGGTGRGGGSVVENRRVSRGTLESLLLKIGRDEALPAIRAVGMARGGSAGGGTDSGGRREVTGTGMEPGAAARMGEIAAREGGGILQSERGAGTGTDLAAAAFARALRRLNTMAWTIYGSLSSALPSLPTPESSLPFLYPTSVALFQPLAAALFDSAPEGDGRPIQGGASALAVGRGLADVRRGLGVSLHQQLLCVLQTGFEAWMAAAQATASPSGDERGAKNGAGSAARNGGEVGTEIEDQSGHAADRSAAGGERLAHPFWRELAAAGGRECAWAGGCSHAGGGQTFGTDELEAVTRDGTATTGLEPLTVALSCGVADTAAALRSHLSCVPHPWHVPDAADHLAVLPSILRFLHSLLSDYHSVFGPGGPMALPPPAVSHLVRAYFELYAVAFEHAPRMRLVGAAAGGAAAGAASAAAGKARPLPLPAESTTGLDPAFFFLPPEEAAAHAARRADAAADHAADSGGRGAAAGDTGGEDRLSSVLPEAILTKMEVTRRRLGGGEEALAELLGRSHEEARRHPEVVSVLGPPQTSAGAEPKPDLETATVSEPRPDLEQRHPDLEQPRPNLEQLGPHLEQPRLDPNAGGLAVSWDAAGGRIAPQGGEPDRFPPPVFPGAARAGVRLPAAVALPPPARPMRTSEVSPRVGAGEGTKVPQRESRPARVPAGGPNGNVPVGGPSESIPVGGTSGPVPAGGTSGPMSLGGLSSGLPADSVLAAQADALALIRAGHKANNDNDHQRAMACFEAAYVLSPQVPTLISAANMHLKVSSCGVAIALYQHILHPPANGGTDNGPSGPGLLSPLNPRHRAIAQRKLDESEEMARALGATLEALQAKYEEAVRAREAEEEAEAEAQAQAVAAEAPAAASAKEVEGVGGAGHAAEGSSLDPASEGRASSSAFPDAPPNGVSHWPPGVPPQPRLSTREIAELQAERARNLAQASATRRWESHLTDLQLHQSLHSLQPPQIVALTQALYHDACFELSTFAPAFAPFLAPAATPGDPGSADAAGSATPSDPAARGGTNRHSTSSARGGEEGRGSGGGAAGLRKDGGGEGSVPSRPSPSPALFLWTSRWRAVSSSALEPLSHGALSAADKMEALGEWAPLWPPLESLNRLLVGRGMERLVDVHAIVEPLMAEYIANLTTRFDVELESAWDRERWVPLAAPDGHRHAAVVWDIFSLFSSSMDVFFEPARNGGPMRGRWVETVAERCFFILNRFLNRMRQELGSDVSLLPPKPAYAELQDLGGLATGLATGLKALLSDQSRRRSVLTAKDTVSAICVRIHSLSFCMAQLRHLASSIDSSWFALLRRRAADGDTHGAAEPPPVTILHAGAPEAVGACCAELCWLLGAKVIYTDLREPLFESLYCRERDVSGKADPRAPLKPTLSSIAGAAPSAMPGGSVPPPPPGDRSVGSEPGAAVGQPLLVELLEEVLVRLSDELAPPPPRPRPPSHPHPPPRPSVLVSAHPAASPPTNRIPALVSAAMGGSDTRASAGASPDAQTSQHPGPGGRPAAGGASRGTSLHTSWNATGGAAPELSVAVGDDAGDGRQEDGWREEGDRGEDGGELRDAAVRGVMVALVQALERVLLDGGPRRVFVPGDGPALLADVALLREFFFARDEDGIPQGLDEAEVVHTTERLQALVLLMHSPTVELTNRFIRPSEPLPDSDNSNPLTRANLARILLHRAAADPTAKAFVAGHRAWMGRVLARNSARDESVRERCFGGSTRHPLASPTQRWDGTPPMDSPRADPADRRTPGTSPAPTTPPARTANSLSPVGPRSAGAGGDASESDDPFDTPTTARLLATPPQSLGGGAGDAGLGGGGCAAQGGQRAGGAGFAGSQVITQSF